MFENSWSAIRGNITEKLGEFYLAYYRKRLASMQHDLAELARIMPTLFEPETVDNLDVDIFEAMRHLASIQEIVYPACLAEERGTHDT